MEIPQKALRPRRPKAVPSARELLYGLHDLISHNALPTSEAVPSVDKCAWEKIFQNAYALRGMPL